MSADPTIGVVGLGRIGGAATRRLVDCGFRVVAHDLDPRAVDVVAEIGVFAAGTPADVADRSDIVLVSLPAPRISEAVICGEAGLLSAARSGMAIAELSTLSLASVQRLAGACTTAGVEFIDAPVMGSRERARSGELVIVVGGPQRSVEMCMPALKALGAKIHHMGESPGAGTVTKLINQLLVIVGLVSGFEAVALGGRAGAELGLDMERLHQVISEGTGSSMIWREPIATLLSGKKVGTTIEILHKDPTLVCELASQLDVDLPVLDAARHVVSDWRERGVGADDILEILEDIRQRYGLAPDSSGFAST
jgi:3-hydroxyisobutyrate dehydrogenase-like beta-hydroxyacid dehydrogenase